MKYISVESAAPKPAPSKKPAARKAAPVAKKPAPARPTKGATWSAIEGRARVLANERGITFARAVAETLKADPVLYLRYLEAK